MGYTLRRHLNHNDIIVALPGFLLRQTNPGYLVGGMQEIGVIGPVELIGFTHDVTGGGHASLTSFEHLHWWADQVTNRIDIGHARTHVFVNENLTLLSDCHAQHFPVMFGFRSLSGADE